MNKTGQAIGFGFLLLVCIGLTAFATFLWQTMHDAQQVPIEQYQLFGETEYLDRESLQKNLHLQVAASFFAADVNHIHRLVEQEPWVFQASVRKKWPNQVHIYVVEQAPFARWNVDLLLNPQGDVFSGQTAHDLPEFFGPSGAEKTVMEGFQTMSLLLSSAQLEIQTVILSERYAWEVILKNNIRLVLGRQAFITRIQRFLEIYPLLVKDNKTIDYVDLRYDTGAAIGWKKG